MRAEIAEMPDGVYAFEDNVIDNDGVTSEPAAAVRVTIDGDRMTVDYTGSDPQRRGPVNCTYGVTASATYNALLHLTDHSIPSNHGCYRPVRIIAPHGTIVNVAYPGASVGGNSEIHPHLVMAIYGALARRCRIASRHTTAAPRRSSRRRRPPRHGRGLRKSHQRRLRLGRAGDEGRQ